MATKKAKKKAPAKKPVRKSPELVALGRIEHLLQQIVDHVTHPVVTVNLGPKLPTALAAVSAAAVDAVTAGADVRQESATAASEPTDAELLS